MPILNEINSIRKFLDSLDCQTLQPYEIIIIDGGSTDGTFEVIKSWSEVNLDKRIILQLRESSPAKKRNLGIRTTKTGLIVFMDCGCDYSKYYFEQLSLTKVKFKSKAVFSTYGVVSESTEVKIKLDSKYYLFKDEHWNTWIPSIRSALIDKSVFDELEFDEDLELYGDDSLFLFELISSLNFICIITFPLVYWHAPDNIQDLESKFNKYYFADGLISCRDIWYQGYAKIHKPEIYHFFYQGLMSRAIYDSRRNCLSGVHVFCIYDFHQLDRRIIDKIESLSKNNRVIISFLNSDDLSSINVSPLAIQAKKPSNISIVLKDQFNEIIKSYSDLGFRVKIH